MSIIVEAIVKIHVDLPEGDPEVEDGQFDFPRPVRDRAILAALDFLPHGNGSIYIDGSKKPPTRIYIDYSDTNANEVYLGD